MPRKISIDELQARAPKDALEQFYNSHKLFETCEQFHISQKQLTELLEFYGIHKRTKEEAFEIRRQTMAEKLEVESTNTEDDTSNSAIDETVVEEVYDLSQFFDEHHLKYEKNADVDGQIFDFAVYKNNRLKLLIDCETEYGYATQANFIKYQKIKRLDVLYTQFIYDDIDNSCANILKLLEIDINQYIIDTFHWCKEGNFPYPQYSNWALERAFFNICEYTPGDTFDREVCDRRFLHFHPTFWKSNKLSMLSPLSMWVNDKLLLANIRNKCIIKGLDFDRSAVLKGLDQSTISSNVDYDDIYEDKYLIQKYLSEYNTIFDPFSGFSERLIASSASGKKYIGQEINETIVKETENLIAHFHLPAFVTCCDSFSSSGDYECMFANVPSGKELYFQNIKQHSTDEWITQLLKNYKCDRYLFVVKSTQMYRKNIVEQINDHQIIVINKQ